MKRTIASVLVALVVVLVLSGCGSSKEPDTKLTIWTNMSVEAETIQAYADEWGTANGYQVEVIHQSPSVQKFAQAIKSEDGPDAVVGIPNDQLADYVNAGLAAEVPADLTRMKILLMRQFRRAASAVSAMPRRFPLKRPPSSTIPIW